MTTFINRQHSSIENFHHFFDYNNFHQKTTSITGQLSSKAKFHQKTTLVCFNRQLSSSLTRATSVKALEAIFKSSVKSPKVILTHQSHISQISRRHLHAPESYQSSLLKISSLTRVTSVKSLKAILKSSVKSPKVILTHHSHINQVSRRHIHTPWSHQSSQC